jgi:hypothetical protein
MVAVLAKSLYALVGAVFLFAGFAVLALGTGHLPPAVEDLIVALGHDDPNTLHIMQEFASLLVFVGLIALWFVRHYEHSRMFHWAMTLFWGLIALVHWVDIRGNFEAGLGQAINTVPAAVFLLVGLLRWRTEKTRSKK